MDIKSAIAAPNSLAPNPWSVSTSVHLPQLTDSIGSMSPRPPYADFKNEVLPDSSGRDILKRENPFQETPQPKRTMQSQANADIKFETDYFVRKRGDDNSDDSDGSTTFKEDKLDAALVDIAAPPQATPSSLIAAPPSAPSPVFSSRTNPKVSGAGFVTRKMHKLNDLGDRAEGCRKELKRVTAAITALEGRASYSVSCGNATWFVASLVTLGEEKEAVRAILEKTTRRLSAKMGRLEKQRKQETEKKHQLEAKRLSNRAQIKAKSGSKVSQVDLTRDFKVVSKIDPDAKAEVLGTFREVETRCIVKMEPGPHEELKIKVEPRIKIEED